MWEWNEAIVVGSYRGLRGGSFISTYFGTLHAAHRISGYPMRESIHVGFRVAEVHAPDVDNDGDVDLRDYAFFEVGFTGDLEDYAVFQNLMTGPAR